MATATKASELAELRAQVEAQEQKLEEMKSARITKGISAGGRVPWATSGPVGQDSKRFSLSNFLLNGVTGRDADRAKFELGVMGEFRKAIHDTQGGSAIVGSAGSSFWVPFDVDLMGDDVANHKGGRECKAVLAGAMQTRQSAYDPDEANWMVRKGFITKAVAQSAYTDLYGGALVAPPVQGEVIPFIRPQAAFLAAGAKTQALPPQGRMVRPRLTSATTAMALGEGQTTIQSNVTTNQMELQAKKIAGAVTINEEATAFTSGTLDQIIQADLGRTLGLKIDAYAFYGAGTTLQPAGLTNSTYTGAVIDIVNDYPTASGIQANGNVLLPQYGDQIPTLIEERSFSTDAGQGAWIMRPAGLSKARSARASAITTGDQDGPYVDILKKFVEGGPTQWCGRRVVTTTNLRNNLTKGSATDLSDAFYGIWQYGIMATYGAIEFKQGMDGNTFLNGQYILRGTMWGDIGYEYPQAFAWFTKVQGAAGLLT